MAIAIVAIPSQDDYVWRISSEKIPHLTLCFLGDNLNNMSHVEEFLAHAVDTSLTQFGMDVDHRGVLGVDLADVLFFGDFSRPMLEQFRANLLTNTDIFTAYNSVAQHPEWIPHLTLGWPTAPAKPDNRDFPGTTWVNFDKIALWTGNFEGVEFPLKKSNSLSMATARGENFLKHFGVKGMKWGVVHDKVTNHPVAKAVASSPDHKTAAMIRTKAKVAGVNTLSNKELEDLLTRMNLETRFVNLKQVEHDQSLVGKGKKWAANFLTDVLKDAAASWIRRPGGRDRGPVKVKAWTTGQQVSQAIDGSVAPRAIGQ